MTCKLCQFLVAIFAACMSMLFFAISGYAAVNVNGDTVLDKWLAWVTFVFAIGAAFAFTATIVQGKSFFESLCKTPVSDQQ